MKPRAVCLLSGGIDSAVAAALTKDIYELTALTVEYGQPTIEKKCSVMIAEWLKIEKPLCRIMPTMSARPGPENYFPGRNTILLSFAMQLAEQIGGSFIVIGANFDDYDNYPDCRRVFFDAAEDAFSLALRRPLKIDAPLVKSTKAEVVKLALSLGVPLEKTSSCYKPRAQTACGACNACLLRKKAFEANALEFKCEPIDTTSLSKGAWPENWSRDDGE